jgi:hypothetical protein
MIDPNYLKMISDRLEAMNMNSPSPAGEIRGEYKIPSIEEQMGQTALHYLRNKEKENSRNQDRSQEGWI